jgi:hypothetical protein
MHVYLSRPLSTSTIPHSLRERHINSGHTTTSHHLQHLPRLKATHLPCIHLLRSQLPKIIPQIATRRPLLRRPRTPQPRLQPIHRPIIKPLLPQLPAKPATPRPMRPEIIRRTTQFRLPMIACKPKVNISAQGPKKLEKCLALRNGKMHTYISPCAAVSAS